MKLPAAEIKPDAVLPEIISRLHASQFRLIHTESGQLLLLQQQFIHQRCCLPSSQ
ncbi:hypothetical protein [Aquitalea sp. LB_tupeE]|uniref:hypothetical protein n=1 Tax=Aquitalea sp. LB_tupeE TaxID=2748078 RepID=UPI0015BAB98D|nr:hypothetical protein [Aquitalea sp. LB_tupeE]NWK79486.1 hypothetical protein [Aquitalea sp. LB_tupeE]